RRRRSDRGFGLVEKPRFTLGASLHGPAEREGEHERSAHSRSVTDTGVELTRRRRSVTHSGPFPGAIPGSWRWHLACIPGGPSWGGNVDVTNAATAAHAGRWTGAGPARAARRTQGRGRRWAAARLLRPLL